MGHVQHKNSEGQNIASVSEVPNITKDFFYEDMSGYYDWICRQQHGKDDRCCEKAAKAYYKECADLGNDIHALREGFLKGEPFSDGVPEYQANVFEPVARFYKESGYKPLYVEQQMTGKEFGGTLDGAGTFSKPFWEEQRKTFWDKYSVNLETAKPTTDSVWVEDLKVKSELDPLHPLQLYGYSLLLKELYDVRANWGLIIRREKKLEKRPELQLRAYYLPAFKEQWDAAMLMWKFLNQ